MTLTVKMKMIILAAGIVLSLSLLGGTTIWCARYVDGVADDASLANHRLALLSEMETASAELLLEATNTLASAKPEAEAMALVDKAADRLQRQGKELAATAVSPQGKEELGRLAKLAAQLAGTVRLDLGQRLADDGSVRGNALAALADFQAVAGKEAETLDRDLTAALEAVRAASQAEAERMTEAIDQAITFSTAAFLLAILTLVPLTVHTAWTLSGTLGKTLKFSRAVAEGDFDMELKTRRRDEVGQLCEALGRITATLQDVMDRTTRVSR